MTDGIAHGTTKGYRRHRYLGLMPCKACRAANAAQSRVDRKPRGSRIVERKREVAITFDQFAEARGYDMATRSYA